MYDKERLYIWVEPDFAQTPWYVEFSEGIKIGLTVRRQKTDIYIGEKFFTVPEPRAVFILAGNSFKWYHEALNFVKKFDGKACIVGCEYGFDNDVSTISADYRKDAYQMVNYMYDLGRKKIALFGAYRTSPHDYSRVIGYLEAVRFLGLPLTEADVFYIEKNVEEEVDSFIKNIAKYDAVVVTNDLFAFYLITRLRPLGIRIPEDIYMAAEGNTVLAQISKPTISSISINLREAGIQAVYCADYLKKNWKMVQYSCFVESVFYPRQSTEYAPFFCDNINYGENSNGFINKNIPDNSWLSAIGKIEKIFQENKNDEIEIIKKLISDSSLCDIADELFVSQSTLNYRLNRLYTLFGVSNRKELSNLLKSYLPYVDFDTLEQIQKVPPFYISG